MIERAEIIGVRGPATEIYPWGYTVPMVKLPAAERVLVVVAHPDDESFGLGALIHEFVTAGAAVEVLCLTAGEASTLGAHPDLAVTRSEELHAACDVLGVRGVELCDLPDGGLADVDPLELQARVEVGVGRFAPDLILTFDPLDGVTGHPDHRAASDAAIRVGRAHGIPVLGWALPEDVTKVIQDEFGVALAGYPREELDLAVEVTRDVQLEAARAHTSQAVPGSLLWRRLELLGQKEYLRDLAS